MIVMVPKLFGRKKAKPMALRKQPNLAGRSLRNVDYRNHDLRGIHAVGASLENGDLRGADLRDASLDHGRFDGANLAGAELTDASCRHTRWLNSNLNQAVASNVDFAGAHFQGTAAREANFRRSTFHGAKFIYADFAGADLRGADLSTADFDHTLPPSFKGAVASGKTSWPERFDPVAAGVVIDTADPNPS